MNGQVKIIKNDKDYEAALARIDELMDCADGNPDREDELDLLSLLVEKYEEDNFDIELPDPVDAIKFRMEQEGLKRKDLVAYIGSQSKVSEVLNRKRPLSLSMIRALHEGLGIPAEVLLRNTEAKIGKCRYDLNDYPFTEMFKRGYFKATFEKLTEAKQYAEECLEAFFENFNKMNMAPAYRRANSSMGDDKSLDAWLAEAVNVVSGEKLKAFSEKDINENFLKRLAGLSYFAEGVKLVKEALNKIGIHFIILPHLPKTKVDAACFFTVSNNPVVAMTLRYDRLDNFWFTLFHELGHIKLGHVTSGKPAYIMDEIDGESTDVDVKENEADAFANDALIPSEIWEEGKHAITRERDVVRLAETLGVSPAIVAGRWRWEFKNYIKFSSLIGQGEVRKYLLEV